MGDSSLRFLHYILETVPKSWCYLSSSIKSKNPEKKVFVESSKVFQYKCLNDKTYSKILDNAHLGEVDILDYDIRQLELRKILPPKWSTKDIANITEKIQDDAIEFVIFPMLLIKKSGDCKKGRDSKKHMVYIVLSTKSGGIELWDDNFGYVHKMFNLTELIMENMSLMLIPLLATFGIDRESKVIFPKNLEYKYKTLHDILINKGYPGDYGHIYRLFLLNYIKYRIRGDNVNKTMIECSKKCLTGKPDTLLKVLSTHDTWCKKYLDDKTKCERTDEGKGDLQVRNLETGQCVSASGSAGQEVQNIAPPCAKNEYLNGKDCVKIKQYFVKHYRDLDEHIGMFEPALIEFLIKKNPHCALIQPKDFNHGNEFDWDIDEKTGKRVLLPPDDIDEFMKNALANEKIRLIVFFLRIRGSDYGWHENAVIMDKKLRTIEHYEPNGARVNKTLDNDYRLDRAIKKYFKKYDYEYIDRLNTCVGDLHKLDWSELELLMANPAGNCQIWTVWYVYMRMKYPDVHRNDLEKYAVQEIRKMGSFKQFINGLHAFLLRRVKSIRSSSESTS